MPVRSPSHVLLVAVVSMVLAAACTSVQERSGPSTPAGSTAATTTPGTIPGATVPEGTIKPAVATTASSDTRSMTTPDGRERTYNVYVPATLPKDQPVPLLVALHGGTGWGKQFERNSGFDGLAEANGFIVVYPDGIEIGPAFPMGRVWNGGDCCRPASTQNVDDVGFISQIIDQLEASYPIDAKRVYAAGHSNGGIMAYRLACELADKIVGIGLQAGWLAVPQDACVPSQPVSVIQIHGTADQNAPIEGGRGERSISGTVATPALENVAFMARRAGCPPAPEETVAGDLTTESWSPCRAGTAVELVKVQGANHAWMGHPGNPISERVVGEPYMGLDSSAEIWAFLAAHPRQ